MEQKRFALLEARPSCVTCQVTIFINVPSDIPSLMIDYAAILPSSRIAFTKELFSSEDTSSGVRPYA